MSMIRIHILGAGGAVPTPTHTPAAYQVVVDDSALLMDPGPGALVRLVQGGLAPRGVDDIERVLLTHLHPDHCADLLALLFALHSPIPERSDPLHLIGPRGLVDYLKRLGDLYGSWLEPRQRDLQIEEIEPGQSVSLGGDAVAEAFAVNHPQDRFAETPLGYRFTDAAGNVLVFSGDTGSCPELNAGAAGADLLVVECSTSDELATAGHMTPTLVARLCRDSRPRRVVLTHQYPPAAALDLSALIEPHCDCPVIQARDGDVFTVPQTIPDSAG